MREYKPDKILSFKCTEHIEKEYTIQRVYTRHNRVKASLYPMETTTQKDIIIVPSDLITDLKDNSPHGYIGKVKEGYYRIHNQLVKLSNAHCVYNGVAYVSISLAEIDTKEDIKLLFNSTVGFLDKEYKSGRLDDGMYDICKHFESLGFSTAFCCNGHNKRKAYISFSSYIDVTKLEKLLSSETYISIIHKEHTLGNFEFIQIQFDFCDDNIQKILNIKGV